MCTANKESGSSTFPTQIYTNEKLLLKNAEISQINRSSESSCENASFCDMTENIILKNDSKEVPVSVFDVARYILKKIDSCTTMKLHKLLYYCQSWNLVWEDKPLFVQPIEAWANGPVVRTLFNFHRGQYIISYNDFTLGSEALLSNNQKENIDEVLNFYGDKSAQWLIDQTHSERPWQQARIGMGLEDRGAREIPLSTMHEYYASL